MTLCLAGPMAAGKNCVATLLERRGFASLDADLVAHEAVEHCKGQILAAFAPLARQRGIALLDTSGMINRRNLAQLVFADPALLALHEGIVFPYIDSVLQAFIKGNAGRDVALNATVLYKVPAMHMADCVLFVDAPVLCRLLRAKKRDGSSVVALLRRFASQRQLLAKYEATGVPVVRICNTASVASLDRKVDEALAKIKSLTSTQNS